MGLLKYTSTGATVAETVVPEVADRLTGVLFGLALKSVADAVNVLLPVILKIQYVVFAVRPPVVLAGTKGIPFITPYAALVGSSKSCDTVISSVEASVSVIVNMACAFAIFRGRPICFSFMLICGFYSTTRRGPHKLTPCKL